MIYPKISIVTPSFNQGRFLERTILSVLEQDYPNLEYIIVDGGSTDESVDIIRKYEKHLTYWCSEADRGQSHAINKGFAKATGDLYAWLNSDDYYTPGALGKIAAARAAHPKAGAIVGAGEMVDEAGNTVAYVRRTTIDLASVSNWFNEFFWQPSCFFSSQAWAECGPLDETVHFAMDLDLWIKIARKYQFVTIEGDLSRNLKHPLAKTTRYNLESNLDAIKVIKRNVGVVPAEKLYSQLISDPAWKIMPPSAGSESIFLRLMSRLRRFALLTG